MKNTHLTLIVIAILSVIACNKPAAPTDKKAELAALKKQQTELMSKITQLEKELNANDTTKKEKIYNVNVQPVTPSVFRHFIELQGAVVAEDEYFLSAKVPGAVTKVNLNVGDRVKAGQVVATIDDDMLNSQLDEIKKRWELANDVYIKQKALWDQNIGSEVQYLSAKNNKEALEKAMATLEKGRENYRIIAPISGVVDEVNLRLGQVVSPGMPLARIVNFAKLKVKVDAPESYAGKLRAGSGVSINFPDLNKEVASKISYVGSSVNQANRTFKIEIPIRANEPSVIPNLSSIVKVVDYANPNAFSIPINLIQKDLTGSDYVMIAEGDRAKKVIVRVGRSYNDQAEVLGGLKVGDKLVVVGYQDLSDGDKIQIN